MQSVPSQTPIANLVDRTRGRPLLTKLPNELILQIFCQTKTIREALNLSSTCSQFLKLFRKNKLRILRSVVDVPSDRNYNLTNSISKLHQLPPSKWRIKGEKNISYEFTVDYSEFSQEDIAEYKIRDMRTISNDSPNQDFQASLAEFISQFKNEKRARWQYEPLTCEILSGAVKLQEDILSMMSPMPEDLSGDSTLIASALNCLATTIPFFDITCLCPIGSLGHDTNTILSTARRQVRGNGADLRPFVEVREVKTVEESSEAPVKPGWKLDATIESMLQHTICLVHQLLNKRDPRNWPTALYVLLILNLIKANFDTHVSWMKPLRTIENALREAISDLSRLYYICAQGGQPLTFHGRYHIDEEVYETLVGDCPTAVHHWGLLEEMWFDEMMERRAYGQGLPKSFRGLKGFVKKLDLFAFSFI